MTEDKRSRFGRIFPARVQKIRDQLRILGNCSNKSSYAWKQEQIQMFFALILQEFASLARSFGVNVTAKVDSKDIQEFKYTP